MSELLREDGAGAGKKYATGRGEVYKVCKVKRWEKQGRVRGCFSARGRRDGEWMMSKSQG